jgi:hypothetical protein
MLWNELQCAMYGAPDVGGKRGDREDGKEASAGHWEIR